MNLKRRIEALEAGGVAPEADDDDPAWGFRIDDFMQRIDRHVYPEFPAKLQAYFDSTPSLRDKLAALERLIEFGPTGRPAAAEVSECADEPVILRLDPAAQTT